MSSVQRPHNSLGYSRIFFPIPAGEDVKSICQYVKNIYPRPENTRTKPDDEHGGYILFLSYKSFEESSLVRNFLHGKPYPYSRNENFRFNIQFAFHTGELCSYFLFRNKFLSIEDYVKVFEKYPTYLGYRIVTGRSTSTISVLARFKSVEDCRQSVQELRQFNIDEDQVIGCISHHDKQAVMDYVMMEGEYRKMANLPEFHEVYNKKQVTMEEFNETTMRNSEAWFNEIEDSRWSVLPYTENTHEDDYITDMWRDNFRSF